MKRLIAAAAIALLPGIAHAEERDYCPERPGLGTPACTIAPGRVSVETGLVDWTRDEDSSQRSDTILIGDTLVRIGLTDTIEAQVGWTPFGHMRTRDKNSGAIDRANRVGDVSLGFKANLRNPDGSGFAVAVHPFVTLPTGRSPIGAGDWGAGLVVPATYDLSNTLNLAFTPELDAAVDQDGSGRHLAFSGTVGLAVALNHEVTGTIEFQALRDDDPSGATTQTRAGLSLGWMASDALQLDIGGAVGLNHASPDGELYLGISRRF
ncbi:MAG: transporter [Pseudomonadota bacterium]|uniref:transporter n=1 Tax=Sphingomonas sp. ERG5 TaxID=1381597 RepID=UPI00054B432F|nr:transporter [Sphingomonas sp. ERG5]